MKDKCGIVGIYSNDSSKEVAPSIYYALYALQHRGQESAGIATYNDINGINYYCGMGLVADVFKDYEIQKLDGYVGIGHVRYSTTGQSKLENSQPFVTDFEGGYIAMAHNGDIVNSKQLRMQLERKGYEFNSDTDSEVLCYLIKEVHSQSDNMIDTFEKISRMIIGSYSLVILINNELYIVRDPKGMKPLVIAKKGDTFIAASETVAFDVLSADFIRDLEPGEIISVVDGNISSHILEIADETQNARCMFEYVYFARPDSVIDKQSVFDTRLKIGRYLYDEFPFDADLVVPVPDSAIPAAIGYSRASGIPYGEGLIKNRYVGRTFIKPQQKSRESSVRVKLNVLKEVVKGKRVIMIDDSIVRGTTSDRIVQMVREAGATEVHMRISSPPFISECYFGTDIPSKEQLIAHNRTVEEINDVIGADSLGYLKVERLKELSRGQEICMGCFTGEYPLEPPKEDIRGEYKK